MKLIIASNNAHKIHEIKQILSGKFDEILSLDFERKNFFHNDLFSQIILNYFDKISLFIVDL